MHLLWLNPFAVYLKLSQHCQSTILRNKIEKLKKLKKKIEVSPVIVPACWLIVQGGGTVDSSGFLKLKRQSWKSSETERQITGQGTRGERATQTKSEQGPSHACGRTPGSPLRYLCHTREENTQSQGKSQKCLEESRLGANTAPPPDWKASQFMGHWVIHSEAFCFSNEIERCLLLGRKVMANLDSTLKSRDVTLPGKVLLGPRLWFFQ